jgi:hypothetical protein
MTEPSGVSDLRLILWDFRGTIIASIITLLIIGGWAAYAWFR